MLVIAWYKRFIALLLKLPVGRGACKIVEQMVAYSHYGGQLVLRRSVVLHVGLAIQGDKGRGTSSPRTTRPGGRIHGGSTPWSPIPIPACHASFEQKLQPVQCHIPSPPPSILICAQIFGY